MQEHVASKLEQSLIGMSAMYLGLAMKAARDLSSPDDVQTAETLHEDLKLYPRLTVTCPHGGGGVRVELVLCDPKTDEAVVSMYQATALSNEAHTL